MHLEDAPRLIERRDRWKPESLHTRTTKNKASTQTRVRPRVSRSTAVTSTLLPPCRVTLPCLSFSWTPLSHSRLFLVFLAFPRVYICMHATTYARPRSASRGRCAFIILLHNEFAGSRGKLSMLNRRFFSRRLAWFFSISFFSFDGLFVLFVAIWKDRLLCVFTPYPFVRDLSRLVSYTYGMNINQNIFRVFNPQSVQLNIISYERKIMILI